MRSSVVLPHPLGPTIMKNSPRRDVDRHVVDGGEGAEGLVEIADADGRPRGQRFGGLLKLGERKGHARALTGLNLPGKRADHNPLFRANRRAVAPAYGFQFCRAC